MYKRCSCTPAEWSSYPGDTRRDTACKWAGVPELTRQLLIRQLSWWEDKPSRQSPSTQWRSAQPEERNQQLKHATSHVIAFHWSKNLQLRSTKALAHPSVLLWHLGASRHSEFTEKGVWEPTSPRGLKRVEYLENLHPAGTKRLSQAVYHQTNQPTKTPTTSHRWDYLHYM